MIDLRLLEYRTVAITPDGEQLDITDITTDLGWEESEREFSSRLSMKIYNAVYKGKYMSEIIQPMTPLIVYVLCNGTSQEVVRGTVASWGVVDSNGTQSISLTAYDELKALRECQDDEYFPDGLSSKQIITSIFDKWGVKYEYNGPDVPQSKWTFKKNYISDMVKKILDDVRKKGKGVYFLRAKEGIVHVLERGSNEDVYHFDADTNLIQVQDNFSTESLVTRVKIIGKSKESSRPPIEATIDGHTEYGIKQVIMERPQNKTLEEVTDSANQLLKEKGSLKRTTSLQGPDVPFIRKGDRVRIESGSMQGFWFITSIRHNADDKKMTFKVVEDKDSNDEQYDTAAEDETSGEE